MTSVGYIKLKSWRDLKKKCLSDFNPEMYVYKGQVPLFSQKGSWGAADNAKTNVGEGEYKLLCWKKGEFPPRPPVATVPKEFWIELRVVKNIFGPS